MSNDLIRNGDDDLPPDDLPRNDDPPSEDEDTLHEMPVFNPDGNNDTVESGNSPGDLANKNRTEIAGILDDPDDGGVKLDLPEGEDEAEDEDENEAGFMIRFKELDAMTDGELKHYIEDRGYRLGFSRDASIRNVLTADFYVGHNAINLDEIRAKRDAKETFEFDDNALDVDEKQIANELIVRKEEKSNKKENEEDKREDDVDTLLEEEGTPKKSWFPKRPNFLKREWWEKGQWGDSLYPILKKGPAAGITGGLLSIPGGYVLADLLESGVANTDIATYVAGLPAAGSTSMIIHWLRNWRGSSNAEAAQKRAPVNDGVLSEIKTYAEQPLDHDLIDTEEELRAAEVVDRVGVLRVKDFPLCATEEEYAQEVYRRIYPVLSRQSAAVDAILNDDLLKKQLGAALNPDLYNSYLALLDHKEEIHEKEEHDDHGKSKKKEEHHDDHDDHGEKKKPKKPKELKPLTPANIVQISVQLGRMLYTRHMGKNYFGKSVGIGTATVTSLLTGNIVPLLTCGAIEGGKELRRRYRKSKSNLVFDADGHIVNNTKTGGRKLKLREEKKEEDHEEHPVTKEDVKDALDDRNRAYEEFVGIKKRRDEMMGKIKSAENRRNDFQAKINRDDGEKKITGEKITDLENQIKQYTTDITEIQKGIGQCEQEIGAFALQISQLDIQGGELQAGIDALETAIRDLDTQISQTVTEVQDLESEVTEAEIGARDIDAQIMLVDNEMVVLRSKMSDVSDAGNAIGICNARISAIDKEIEDLLQKHAIELPDTATDAEKNSDRTEKTKMRIRIRKLREERQAILEKRDALEEALHAKEEFDHAKERKNKLEQQKRLMISTITAKKTSNLLRIPQIGKTKRTLEQEKKGKANELAAKRGDVRQKLSVLDKNKREIAQQRSEKDGEKRELQRQKQEKEREKKELEREKSNMTREQKSIDLKVEQTRDDIVRLDIPLDQASLTTLEAEVTSKEKIYENADKEHKKKKKLFEKPHKEKTSVAKQILTAIGAGQGVQFVGSAALKIGTRIAGGMAVGTGGTMLLSQVGGVPRLLLGNTSIQVAAGVGLAAWWTYGYVSNLMTGRATLNKPHAEKHDDKHASDHH